MTCMGIRTRYKLQVNLQLNVARFVVYSLGLTQGYVRVVIIPWELGHV
jgi:hypothetical protein